MYRFFETRSRVYLACNVYIYMYITINIKTFEFKNAILDIAFRARPIQAISVSGIHMMHQK